MASIIDTFLPSVIYNTLPTISQVSGAPEDHSQDLHDLRELLSKHNVPDGVSVRLIHKHFDTNDGEIMVFDKVPVPEHGVVQIMKPMVPPTTNTLRGIHYFVDANGSLQAYEYGNHEVPDMSGFESFITEFCSLVSERGLQHKFGLKLQLQDDADKTGWTEYELHEKRGTIMFPDGMPMPDGETDFSVNTEWKPIVDDNIDTEGGALIHKRPDSKNCKHNVLCKHGRRKCNHCRHCAVHPVNRATQEGSENGFCLGGQEFLPGTQVYDVIRQIIAAF